MTEVHHYADGEIDWETIFERMTGSAESAGSRHNLCRYLAHSRNMSPDDGASVVNNASENGELLEVQVLSPKISDAMFLISTRNRSEPRLPPVVLSALAWDDNNRPTDFVVKSHR